MKIKTDVRLTLDLSDTPLGDLTAVDIDEEVELEIDADDVLDELETGELIDALKSRNITDKQESELSDMLPECECEGVDLDNMVTKMKFDAFVAGHEGKSLEAIEAFFK